MRRRTKLMGGEVTDRVFWRWQPDFYSTAPAAA
jgi:hypothetical protein